MNIIETLFHTVPQPTPPLHTGEAFTLWAYYEAAAESRSIFLVLLNHTEDTDLKELIEHFIADALDPQIKQVREKLLHEGLNLPAVTPDQPRSEARLVPSGARFTDEQIANMIVIKIQGLLQFCHEGITRSLRTDLGTMYFAFQGHVLAQAATLKSLMTKRGWLRIPPTFPPSATSH